MDGYPPRSTDDAELAGESTLTLILILTLTLTQTLTLTLTLSLALTLSLTLTLGVNVTASMTCYSANKGPDFAGVVRLYVSLNGVEFSDTGLTFTYFRAPKISVHTPHGGPV